MLTLGLAGGLDPVYGDLYDSPQNFTYDGAAVLLEDGAVLAAIEEERLNRIRHSNKFPFQAIRACLERRGVRLEDVDRIGYYAAEDVSNALLARLRLARPEAARLPDARTVLAGALGSELRCHVDPAKLTFVPHKLTHAISAFSMSGHEPCLVMVLDTDGGVFRGDSGRGAGSPLSPLASFPQGKSLGSFALVIEQLLGYGPFDEDKVVELSRHGDPAAHRATLKDLYRLLPSGDYELYLDRMGLLLDKIPLRRRGAAPAQVHKDLAAALQEALEEIVLHVLRYHREQTGLTRLCVAGGASQNCGVNTRILASVMFDDVFVHPAAHDAGCAHGAAVHAYHELTGAMKPARPEHVYLGTDIGDGEAVSAALDAWRGFITFERLVDPARQAAQILAGGAILGFAEGRAAFGPNPLGSRSILADPRAIEMRERINQTVKQRERHRPLGLSVLAEDAGELFDVPTGREISPFGSFLARVREDRRELLGAAIHVDGTTRPVGISRATNPRLWALIKAFKDITSVPALLDTSFNNDVEPVVDSAQDAIVSLLTMDLDGLLVGDFLARTRATSWRDKLALVVALPRYVRLCRIKGFVERDRLGIVAELRTTFDARTRRPVSDQACDLLMRADGEKTIAELLRASGAAGDEAAQRSVEELSQLWSRRLVTLRPAPAAP